MRINEILIEADKYGRSKVLTVEQFKALKPQLSLALKKTEENNRIFRGTSNPNPIIEVDPREVERVSRNTTNEYNLLFSHILSSWQEWPKRSRSLICSGDYREASAYSIDGPYIVLPLGNPQIAIAPHGDFWNSFAIDLPEFNELFNDFLKTFRMFFPRAKLSGRIETVPEMIRFLKLVDQTVVTDPEEMAKMIADFESGYNGSKRRKISGILTQGNSIDQLDLFFDPSKNGFKLLPYDSYSSTNNEVWFSSPAVLIHSSTFDKIMN